MIRTRFGFGPRLFVAFLTLSAPVFAQLAPSGEHYAGRPSDTGYGGAAVDSTGGFPTSVSLELPAARDGLPIPLQVSYGAHGVGAAGVGWNLPLSFLQQGNTLAHLRPQSAPDVLPSLTKRTTLSLFGQTTDLLPQGNDWVARIGTLELVVHQSANNWMAYDGEGRTYTFEPAATFQNQGLWLLKSITSANGAMLVLTYQVVTWPVAGGTGTAIDLVKIDYNNLEGVFPRRSCAKHEIVLTYQHGSITPIWLSLLNDRVIVRKNTLSQIEITSRANCQSLPQRLRRYTFTYQADVDTGLPRLTSVNMFGRQGSTEENTSIPVGAYSYGSATSNGALHYNRRHVKDQPTGGGWDKISGTDHD
jgi:hypothetical protein